MATLSHNSVYMHNFDIRITNYFHKAEYTMFTCVSKAIAIAFSKVTGRTLEWRSVVNSAFVGNGLN